MFVLLFIVMFTVADHIFCSKSMNYVKECKYGAAHKISVIIACAQMSNKSRY